MTFKTDFSLYTSTISMFHIVLNFILLKIAMHFLIFVLFYQYVYELNICELFV